MWTVYTFVHARVCVCVCVCVLACVSLAGAPAAVFTVSLPVIILFNIDQQERNDCPDCRAWTIKLFTSLIYKCL